MTVLYPFIDTQTESAFFTGEDLIFLAAACAVGVIVFLAGVTFANWYGNRKRRK